MATPKHTVSFVFSGSEKRFYDAGKLDGQITSREELAQYINDYCDMIAAEADMGKIIDGLKAIAMKMSEQSEGGKKALVASIEAAVANGRLLERLQRTLAFAVDGAKRGWSGK